MLFFACETARHGLFCHRKSGRVSVREKAKAAEPRRMIPPICNAAGTTAPEEIPPDFVSRRNYRIPRGTAANFLRDDSLFGRSAADAGRTLRSAKIAKRLPGKQRLF